MSKNPLQVTHEGNNVMQPNTTRCLALQMHQEYNSTAALYLSLYIYISYNINNIIILHITIYYYRLTFLIAYINIYNIASNIMCTYNMYM